MSNPPQQLRRSPVKNLTQILVKYVASFLHRMAKVRILLSKEFYSNSIVEEKLVGFPSIVK